MSALGTLRLRGKTAHDAGRAACRSNRSVFVAIFSTWPYNSSMYPCVSRRSSVKTVGRIELRLEANSTSRTRKFVVSLKISVLLSQTGLGQFCHGTSSSPCHRPFPLSLCPLPIFCCSFSGCPIFRCQFLRLSFFPLPFLSLPFLP